MTALPYELAKELETAGWPKPNMLCEGVLGYGNEGTLIPLHIEEGQERVYSPSLSELIEGCGEDAQAMIEAYAARWLQLRKEGKV